MAIPASMRPNQLSLLQALKNAINGETEFSTLTDFSTEHPLSKADFSGGKARTTIALLVPDAQLNRHQGPCYAAPIVRFTIWSPIYGQALNVYSQLRSWVEQVIPTVPGHQCKARNLSNEFGPAFDGKTSLYAAFFDFTYHLSLEAA